MQHIYIDKNSTYTYKKHNTYERYLINPLKYPSDMDSLEILFLNLHRMQ